MTDNRVQFFDEPHVMQPGSVAEYLRDFASHLAAQGYQSLRSPITSGPLCISAAGSTQIESH